MGCGLSFEMMIMMMLNGEGGGGLGMDSGVMAY